VKGIRIEDRYGKGEARKGDHSGGSGNCHCRLGLDRVTTAPALSANRCRPVRRPDARRCRTTCAGPYHHGHPPEWPIQAGCDSWQNWAHAARSENHSRRNAVVGRPDPAPRLLRPLQMRIRSSTVLSVGPTTSGFPRLIERLRLFQTKSHGRVRATLGPMSSAAARAKHRHQRLIGFAAYRAVSLNCANIDRGWITLRSRGALWSLWALCPGLALRSRYALDALCALGTRRSLRARVAFWTRVSAATSKRQRHADGKYR
jgi:hypothetical protein